MKQLQKYLCFIGRRVSASGMAQQDVWHGDHCIYVFTAISLLLHCVTGGSSATLRMLPLMKLLSPFPSHNFKSYDTSRRKQSRGFSVGLQSFHSDAVTCKLAWPAVSNPHIFSCVYSSDCKIKICTSWALSSFSEIVNNIVLYVHIFLNIQLHYCQKCGKVTNMWRFLLAENIFSVRAWSCVTVCKWRIGQ
jgi:hypothetical protein